MRVCTMNGTGKDRVNCAETVPNLRTFRNRVGRNSRAGRLLSNLIEQRSWLNDTTGDRSWAKHPTQNLPWMMGVQVEALAKGK
jgi:hypothetical protein